MIFLSSHRLLGRFLMRIGEWGYENSSRRHECVKWDYGPWITGRSFGDCGASMIHIRLLCLRFRLCSCIVTIRSGISNPICHADRSPSLPHFYFGPMLTVMELNMRILVSGTSCSSPPATSSSSPPPFRLLTSTSSTAHTRPISTLTRNSPSS